MEFADGQKRSVGEERSLTAEPNKSALDFFSFKDIRLALHQDEMDCKSEFRAAVISGTERAEKAIPESSA